MTCNEHAACKRTILSRVQVQSTLDGPHGSKMKSMFKPQLAIHRIGFHVLSRGS